MSGLKTLFNLMKVSEKTIKEKVMKDIFLKLMFNINYMNFIMNYHFTWKDEDWKVEELVANLRDKTEYVINTRVSKQALNHEIFLKKVHRKIKCN